jgi:hypothetical protein
MLLRGQLHRQTAPRAFAARKEHGKIRLSRKSLLLVGQRPSNSAVATGTTRLDLGLLGDLWGIVNFDAEIPDGTFKLGMPE